MISRRTSGRESALDGVLERFLWHAGLGEGVASIAVSVAVSHRFEKKKTRQRIRITCKQYPSPALLSGLANKMIWLESSPPVDNMVNGMNDGTGPQQELFWMILVRDLN